MSTKKSKIIFSIILFRTYDLLLSLLRTLIAESTQDTTAVAFPKIMCNTLT